MLVVAISLTVIGLVCLGGIVLMCDDRKGVIEIVKKEKNLFFLILLPVVIWLGYTIYIKQLVWVKNDALWNPYIFNGMPSYTLTYGGFRWWSLINVFVEATKTVFFYNPIGGLAFISSIVWLYYHRFNIFTYLLMLFLEVAALYFAFMGYGISRGYL